MHQELKTPKGSSFYVPRSDSGPRPAMDEIIAHRETDIVMAVAPTRIAAWLAPQVLWRIWAAMAEIGQRHPMMRKSLCHRQKRPPERAAKDEPV